MASLKRSRLQEIIQDESKSPAEKAEVIIEEHLQVVNEIKEERDKLKEQAEKLPDLQKQLEKLTGQAEEFTKERKSFEDYKSKVEQKENLSKIEKAYTQMLKDENYSEKWRERIIESTNFSDMKLDGEGKLVDEKSLRDAVNEKWGDVKTTVTTQGAKVENPPHNGNGKMTMADIYAKDEKGNYKLSTSERQEAIAKNLQKG